MLPGNYDIHTSGNATFSLSITWKDVNNTVIDLTSYTAKMVVALQNNTQVIELTNGSGITLASSSPNIVLGIDYATMETLTCSNGKYDLVLNDGTTQTCLLKGGFSIIEGISQ